MAEGLQESGSSAPVIKAVHDGVWDIELFLNRETAVSYACHGCGHVPKKCMSDEKYKPLCEQCAKPLIDKGDKIVHSPFADGRIAEIKLKCKNKLSKPDESPQQPQQPQQAENKEEKKDENNAAAPASNEECPWNGCVKDWQSHNDKDCTFAIIQCPHCHQYKCSRSLMSQHDGICPEKSIICPQQCGNNILRKNTESHKTNDCLKTILKCRNDGCEQEIIRQIYEQHVTKECKKRIVSCSFRKYGCNQPNIKAEELADHEKNTQIQHLQHQVRYLQHTIEDQVGIIKMYSGKVYDIKDGWKICDGRDGTYDLSDKFVKSVTVNDDDDDEKDAENYALCFIVKVPQSNKSSKSKP